MRGRKPFWLHEIIGLIVAARQDHRDITAQLVSLNEKVAKIMSEQSTEQSDIDAQTAFDTQLDTDIKGLSAQVTNGQQAFDTAIANLQNQIAAGNTQPDLTELKAAQAVLAGDQPTLDAAVAALSSDPNVAPAAPPAAS